MLIKASALKKIPQTLAVEVLTRYQQEASFKRLIAPETTPVELINQLYANKQWQDVVVFLCHSLFAREAIWWGYRCLLSLKDAQLSLEQEEGLNVVNKWLIESTEPIRRLAEAEVKKVGLDNACGWLLQSVFWSGGSITPLNGPESPAPPYLYSHAVAGGICLAALLPDGAQGKKRYQSFIEMGINIAAGGSGS